MPRGPEGDREAWLLSGGHANWALNATEGVALLSQASEEMPALWVQASVGRRIAVGLISMQTLIQTEQSLRL